MIGEFIKEMSDKEIKKYRWYLNDLLMRHRRFGWCAKFGIGERWSALKKVLDSELKLRNLATTIKKEYHF